MLILLQFQNVSNSISCCVAVDELHKCVQNSEDFFKTENEAQLGTK